MRIAFFALAGVIAISSAAKAAETVTYTYDARGRLITVTHAGTVNNGIITTYTVDTADNRTQVVTTGASH